MTRKPGIVVARGFARISSLEISRSTDTTTARCAALASSLSQNTDAEVAHVAELVALLRVQEHDVGRQGRHAAVDDVRPRVRERASRGSTVTGWYGSPAAAAR